MHISAKIFYPELTPKSPGISPDGSGTHTIDGRYELRTRVFRRRGTPRWWSRAAFEAQFCVGHQRQCKGRRTVVKLSSIIVVWKKKPQQKLNPKEIQNCADFYFVHVNFEKNCQKKWTTDSKLKFKLSPGRETRNKHKSRIIGFWVSRFSRCLRFSGKHPPHPEKSAPSRSGLTKMGKKLFWMDHR